MLFSAYMSVEKYFFVEIWLYPSCGNPSSAIVLSLDSIKIYIFLCVIVYAVYDPGPGNPYNVVYLAFFC